jgi:hypothetical protein
VDLAEASQGKVLEQFTTYATCTDEEYTRLLAVS